VPAAHRHEELVAGSFAVFIMCTMFVYRAFSICQSYISGLLGAERGMGGPSRTPLATWRFCWPICIVSTVPSDAALPLLGAAGQHLLQQQKFRLHVVRAMNHLHAHQQLICLCDRQYMCGAVLSHQLRMCVVCCACVLQQGAAYPGHRSHHTGMYVMSAGLFASCVIIAIYKPRWSEAKAMPHAPSSVNLCTNKSTGKSLEQV